MPEGVSHINREKLAGLGFYASLELQKGLAHIGLETSLARTELQTHLKAGMSSRVIIDPTIGQFLDGHNHVFVGTRSQLDQIARAYLYAGRFFGPALNSPLHPNDADMIIPRYWGT